MDQKQLCRQVIEFNKMAFENSFNAVIMLQDHVEKVASAVLMQSAWLPEDGRKAIDEMVRNFKRGRDDFRRAVDDGFKRADSFFRDPGSEQ